MKIIKKVNEKIIIKVITLSAIFLILTAALVGTIAIIKAKNIIYNLNAEELKVSAYQMMDEVSNEYDGEWSFENGILYKGGIEVGTELEEQLDSIHERTDLEYTIFMGNIRAITTLKDSKGNRMVGTEIKTQGALDVLEKGVDFQAFDVRIDNKDYNAYYTPLKNDDGTIAGMVFVGRNKADIKDEINGIVKKVIIAIILFSGISCACGFYLANLVSKKMHMLADEISEIADGYLNKEIDYVLTKRPDEIGTIAKAVAELKNKLSDVIGNAKQLSENIKTAGYDLASSASNAAEASKQVTAAVEDITKGSMTQAESVQTSSDNTNYIGKDIEGITQNIDELNTLVDSMYEASDRTMTAMDGLLEQNKEVTTAVDSIRAAIENTANSVQHISHMTQMISEIADQTNLLSLNATIEAARAGETGRGFAVVASEISNLAIQSQEAVVKIEEVTQQLVDDSISSVQIVDSLIGQFQTQSDQIMIAKDDMGILSDDAKKVQDSVEDTETKTNTMNDRKDELVNIMVELSAISEENAAATQQTNASMEELDATFHIITDNAVKLQSIGEQLRKQISFFKL
ncbi:MAG: methyl-accepting chemotaxis protein [Lachnospiraceae bacterium]|nr:methyl-accepting chemotaxis protein [Lachnospiraceae bacterium]